MPFNTMFEFFKTWNNHPMLAARGLNTVLEFFKA